MEATKVAKWPIEFIYKGFVCEQTDQGFSKSVRELGARLPKKLYWRHAAHWPIAKIVNERTLDYSEYAHLSDGVKWSHAQHNSASIIRGITRKNDKLTLTWCGASFSDITECHAEAVDRYHDKSHPDAVVYQTVGEIINPVEPKRYDPDRDEAMVSWLHEAWSVVRLSFVPDESILKHEIEWN